MFGTSTPRGSLVSTSSIEGLARRRGGRI